MDSSLDQAFGIINGRTEACRRRELCLMEHCFDQNAILQRERIIAYLEAGRIVLQSKKLRATDKIITENITFGKMLRL